jgi:hypothetical protein
MQPAQFEHAIENILKRDKRFDPHAYLFLKDSLDFTLKRAAETNHGQARHVLITMLKQQVAKRKETAELLKKILKEGQDQIQQALDASSKQAAAIEVEPAPGKEDSSNDVAMQDSAKVVDQPEQVNVFDLLYSSSSGS